jgi:WD40 repeat protein/tRNA A-37 threonylcarbamoyl transferase component Bud32
MNSSVKSASDLSRDDELDAIVEEILNQIRHGRRPSLSVLQARYPKWADELTDLLPTLLFAEKLEPSPLTSDIARQSNALGSASINPSEHSPPNSSADEYPTELGDYELLSELGRGGMGIVFSARQKSLDRIVAIKVLARHLARNAKLVERFHREAHSAARLHHKNIVPVYDHGTSNGVSWYAMQQIDGESLNESVERMRAAHESFAGAESGSKSRHPLADYKRLAEIARDAAYALDYAHQHGIIHRDIKPGNLILDQNETIWITDFGLARLDSESQLTQAGDIVGTLRYVAPEQLDGVTAPSCDIYGLGVTLYEIATLRPAWSSDAQGQILEQVRRESVTPPRRIKADVPRDLERIILKAMAREPKDRYASARELGDDLNRFCNDLPIKARVPAVWEQAIRWSRKNRLTASAILISLLLAAVVIPTILISHTLMLQAEIGRVKDAEAKSLAANRKSQRQLAESRILQARALRGSQSITARTDALSAIELGTEDLRLLDAPAELISQLEHRLLTEAIASLALPEFHRQVLLRFQDLEIESPIVLDFSDKKIVLLDLYRGELQTQILSTDQPQSPLWKINQHANFARLIEPQNFIALSSNLESPRQISVWDWTQNELIWREPILSSHWDTESVTVSPGKQFVVGVDPNGRLFRFDLEDRLTQSGGRLANLSHPFSLNCSPSADQVAIVFRDRIEIRDFASGRLRHRIGKPRDAVELSRGYWSPDNRWFAARFADGTTSIYELPTWKLARSFATEAAGGALLDASPDGRYLLTASWALQLKLWDVTKGELITGVSAPLEIHAINFSDHQIGPVVDSQQVLSFEFHPSQVFDCYGLSPNPLVRPYELALSPSGPVLVIGSGDHGLSFFDYVNRRHVSTDLRYDFPIFDRAGNLWAIRQGTIYRWNYRSDSGNPSQIRFDERVSVLQSGGNCFSVSPNEQTIAWTTVAGGVAVADLQETPLRPRVLKAQGDIRFVIVSPDDQWVIAPGWHEPACWVFEVTTGRSWNLAPGYTGTYARFSSDGSHLALAVPGESIRVYRSGKWETPIQIIKSTDGLPAFSMDGTVLAIGTSQGSIALFNLIEDGEPLELILPNGVRARQMLFSHDGTRLFFNSVDSHCVYQWNFAVLNEQLLEMNLDPGLLKRFAAKEPVASVSNVNPLNANSTLPASAADDWVVFEPEETAKQRLEERLNAAYQSGQRNELIEVLQQLIQRFPNDPWYNNNLAWYLAEFPTSDTDQLERSLDLVRIALKRESDNPHFLNTLGVVYYRLGQYQNAIDTLQQARARQSNAADTIEDEYFLSMAEANLKQRMNSARSLLQALSLQLRHDARNRDRWRYATEAIRTLALQMFR